MKITSLEIKQHEFEKSFRGYNVDEVNHFLGNIAQEWDRMLNELKMLKMQLEISEKEAAKLKEVEMTLIKTLKTVEDTSTRITETANAEAAKKIEDANNLAAKTVEEANGFAAKTVEEAKTLAAKTIEEANSLAAKTVEDANYASRKAIDEANLKAEQTKKDAEHTSKQLIADAETKVKEIQTAAEHEIATLDTKYSALESKRNLLLSQLKSYNLEISKIVEDQDIIIPEPQAKIEVAAPVVTVPLEVVKEEPVIVTQETEEEEEKDEDYSNGISLPSAVNAINLDNSNDDQTNLEIIEGIGPKIKEVLVNAGIKDFRTLATTPEYRLKDILSAAGSHFITHDPGTWNEQALLAANGKWEQLDELKRKLIAGRPPKEEPESPVVTDGSNTEEMLDKVNKVKAAIRKAMIEKTEQQDSSSQSKPQSGSFFDSI